MPENKVKRNKVTRVRRTRFIPKNKQKYIGKVDQIFARSSWELRVMTFLDTSPGILKWASEELKIAYVKPTDGRVHYYYPDFFVVYKDKTGIIKKEILEIKPMKEVQLTEKSTLYDKVAIRINKAKWLAAATFAASKGVEFRVITENSLYRKV